MIRVPEGKIEKAVGEDGREGIKHVYFDGTNLVAMNGHILAVVPADIEDSTEKDVPGLIPVEAFEQARREAKGNTIGPRLNLAEKTAASPFTGASFPRPDEKFPPWERAMNPENYYTDEGAIAITFNPALLMRLAESFCKLDKRSSVTMILPKDYVGRSPLRVTVNGSEGWGVIVPVQIAKYGTENVRPASAQPTEEAEAVAVAA